MKYSLLFTVIATIASCTKNLEEINVKTVNPTSLDPALLLNNAIINASFPTKTVIYEEAIVQQMVTPNGGVLAGGNFNQDSRDVTNPPTWAVYYQNVIKYTHDAIAKQKIMRPGQIFTTWRASGRLMHSWYLPTLMAQFHTQKAGPV